MRCLTRLVVTSLLLAAAGRAEPPPNIVFILADDLGYGHLGVYGQRHIRTPHLDQLAAQGLRFTQAYSGAANCGPARASLMTGRHGGHTSMRSNSGGVPLAAGDRTVADVLKAAGYATGAFGKWGLGDAGTAGVPWQRGFDRFFGYLHQKHAHFYYPDYLWENDRKFPLPGNAGGRREQYAHDVILARAEQFIRDHRGGPFFCYLPLTLPHHEFIVPEASLAEYRGRFAEQPLAQWREGYANPREPKATLAAMISHLDRSVGRICDLLRELGLEQNTLVIFTSDNGADDGALTNARFFRANGDLRGYKQQLYEGGIRVPLIARWPARIAAGGVSDLPCHFADVLPTLAELAGAADRIPAGTDGLSLAPLLRGEPVRPPRPGLLYWEKREESGRLLQAIRQGDWKAILTTDGHRTELELYDLARDGREQHDVAAAHPDLAAELRRRLAAEHTEPPPQLEPARPPGLDYR
ncbi:MAG: arylsulfatase [Opitutaceae bacterium]|nr:arylsulfatase [Opitutaceae bacterium]